MKRLKSIFLFVFLLLSFAGITSCTDENGLSSLIEVSISSDKASNIIFTGEQIALTASVEWKQEQPAGYTTTEKWDITEGKSCVDSSESADSKTLTLTGKLHSNAVKVTLTVEVINGKGKRSGSVTKDVTITIKAKLDSSTVDPNVKDFLTDDKKTAAVTYQTVPTNIISIGNDGSITVIGKGTVTVSVFDSSGNKLDEFTLDVSGHFHSYAATWSSDGTYHWKEFTCTTESDHDSNSINPTKEKHNFGADGVCKCGKKEKPEGVIGGKFSVSQNKKVYFSRGNLQATRESVGYSWDFATKQYDIIGDSSGNDTMATKVTGGGGKLPNQGETVDLFAFSSSKNAYSQPEYGISNNYAFNHFGEDGNDSAYPFVDWGNNIKPEDGTVFRTLSKDEWQYIFDQRGGNDNPNGWGTATITKDDGITTVVGVVILPDEWTAPTGLGQFASGYKSGEGVQWTQNEYSASEWQQMEKAGAVFLPAAGEISLLNDGAGSAPPTVYNIGILCGYWSSTKYGFGYQYAYHLSFYCKSDTSAPTVSYSTMNRTTRYPVRLVTEIED